MVWLYLHKRWSSVKTVSLPLGAYLQFVHRKRVSVPLRCLLDAIFKGDFGGVAKQTSCLADISACVRHIAWLVRKDCLVGLLASMFLDQCDEISQRCSSTLAQVKDLVWVRAINSTHNTVHNVADVRVITARSSVSKLLDLNSTADPINEFEWCHIRA